MDSAFVAQCVFIVKTPTLMLAGDASDNVKEQDGTIMLS